MRTLRTLAAAAALLFLPCHALAATSSPGTTGLSINETDGSNSVSLTYFSITSMAIDTVRGTTSITVCAYVSQAAAQANPNGCASGRFFTVNLVPTSDPLLAAYNKLLTLSEFSGAVQVGSP